MKFGATSALSFTINSATSITAIAPAGSAGAVDVTVTTPGGTSSITANDHYTYVAAPTVSSVSPIAGPTAGSTSVTITGTNLGGATAVKFGTNTATITNNTATQIVATNPAGSAGTCRRHSRHRGWHQRHQRQRPVHLRWDADGHGSGSQRRATGRRDDRHDHRHQPQPRQHGQVRRDQRQWRHRSQRHEDHRDGPEAPLWPGPSTSLSRLRAAQAQPGQPTSTPTPTARQSPPSARPRAQPPAAQASRSLAPTWRTRPRSSSGAIPRRSAPTQLRRSSPSRPRVWPGPWT